MKKDNKLLDSIYRYRFVIAAVIFIFCVIFELSGSSIGMWKNFNPSSKNDGVILGISRGIRSDEWAVLTPMTFSQKIDGFNYFNSLIRGGNTDIFMVYGLPVMNPIQIFRPFQIGYLFLGSSRGLSFYWCGRLIALFLVTFEFLMLFTKRNKNLSFIGSVLITLAPIIQWWFSVNGIVEIFVFGQLALILIYKYMNTDILKKRIWYLLLFSICAGGYILVMYPAWQIPLFYVFLALAIWIIIENRKNCKINKKDIISIIIAAILFLVSMLYIYLKSKDTIKLVLNTVYPGNTLSLGGGGLKSYFSYLTNLFLPIKTSGMENTNPCEMALFFGLFPLGIILSLFCIFKKKNKDVALISILICYLFFGLFIVVGFPVFLSKITLLSRSQVFRTTIVIGYMDILLLIRTLSICDLNIKKSVSVIIALFGSVLFTVLCMFFNKNYYFNSATKSIIIMVFITICVLSFLIYFFLNYSKKLSKIILAISISLLMLFVGGTINPVRRGIGIVYDSEIIKQINKINSEEKGVWITEGMVFPSANYILMAGVPVINCTNTYPDLEKWYLIDKNHKYEDVYNRYAHINIYISRDYEEKFELYQPDYFRVNIEPEELETLNVKYIFTVNDLKVYNNDKVNFEEIYSYNEYKIYKVIYSGE